MERRDFIKLTALTTGTAALAACGHPEHSLIRFLPEEELVPGVAVWKPSVCPLCPAGCGLLVRVMEGEAEVVRDGKVGLLKMGLAKKLEGNPAHPVNRGRLCARGQAAVQIPYHPDRVRHPLRRAGAREDGRFEETSWEEALKALVEKLRALEANRQGAAVAFVTRPLRGARRELVERFLAALGAPPPVFFEFFDEAVLRRANELSFGRYQLPTMDLGRANYVLSFAADFLGTWNSPVAQALGYGEMRQGRPGVRGKFVQVERRMSQSGASADEWFSARPGTEGVLALGLAHVLMQERLRPAGAARNAAARIEGWSQGLPQYTPAEVEKKTGVQAERVVRIAREMAAHPPAIAIVGGAPLAHTNGLFAALAVNALNALLGSFGTSGGMLFTPLAETAPATTAANSLRGLAERVLAAPGNSVQVLFLNEANPVFATPPAWRMREAIQKIPFIVSFGSFIDETGQYADLILPDHSFLESWLDDVPESGTTQDVITLAPPAMRPLHNTRALPDVLLEAAHQLGTKAQRALPWKGFEEMLRARFGRRVRGDVDEQWRKAIQQGVWLGPEQKTRPAARIAAARQTPGAAPEFDGAEREYPFHFLPYASQAFLDGSLAHLPWLQEMPDVISTVMWETWVEIHPRTAEQLGIEQEDIVEVVSQHGRVEAPALISPGIAPDTIAMPVGQGHQNFTRYASGRGANPIQILAPMVEPETGSLAWAATRVKLSRKGKGRLVQFAGGRSRFPHETEER